MSKLAWTPWHQVVQLRKELRDRELSLSIFAADLYDVIMDVGRSLYRVPTEFFALTYPTLNLRDLAKDVVLRLAGRTDRAVRQLELTYGGGKTHALITLRHLVHDPERLPRLPAVEEFIHHIGMQPPKARVAVIPFDKLDVEKGMEVRAPGGETRWLRHPWSVLAYQIASDDGLRMLHPEDRAEERESAPAENLLVQLLSLPAREDLATLVLMDEVLMYAREKVSLDPVWQGRLQNFFQYLTQAATKVDRCAIVASLLATDPRKHDALGKQILDDLYAVFRREREEGVQPVLKEDVAEVLRRRFFTAESISNPAAFRPHVAAALRGIGALDETTRKAMASAESRFLASYPFHPDLTEVLYGKWTNLENFQRTRGVLRTFAMALRDAATWDQSPLVGANVFLAPPGQAAVSEAARELTSVASAEEHDGGRHEWTAIVEGELVKARKIQDDGAGLRHREVEQAVFATFLHSQPIGQKALTRELLVLLGPTSPDRIELEKALGQWAETSWFLEESSLSDIEPRPEGQPRGLPRSWRLGPLPNLRQMHDDAVRNRVSDEQVDTILIEWIRRQKSLTVGASAAGAHPHLLPKTPNDVDDDGEFHFAVLGPDAACDPGRPGTEVRRYLDETTGPDRPRTNRNAVVFAVPSRTGLDAARAAVRDYLGWEDVQAQLAKQATVDALHRQRLEAKLTASRQAIPDKIQQAYCVAVTASDKNEPIAVRVNVGKDGLFAAIKSDSRLRIQDTAISPDALLPGGPYGLWRDGETTRLAKDLVGAFAASPELPKMLSRQAILDTLVEGCVQGAFVLRQTRADRSLRTFWQQSPDAVALSDPSLDVVLPEAATLATLEPDLLPEGKLPELWKGPMLTFRDVVSYFDGKRIIKIPREGYDEPVHIPHAPRDVVETAVRSAVGAGRLWLIAGSASILGEELPPGVLHDGSTLQSPPAPVLPNALLPEALPAAWRDGRTTALSLQTALSTQAGRTLPWTVIRDGISVAWRAGMLVTAPGSADWPCPASGAKDVILEVPQDLPPPPLSPAELAAEAELHAGDLQTLAEIVPEVLRVAAGLDLHFHLRVSVRHAGRPEDVTVVAINELLERVSGDLRLG